MGAGGHLDDDLQCSVPPEEPFLMSRSRTALPIPPGPPPEVLCEIDEAWERAQEPLAEGLELHFESEPLLGRAWGVLRRANGTVAEHIGAVTAVALACGDGAVLAPGLTV
jgi:hypothetical protein